MFTINGHTFLKRNCLNLLYFIHYRELKSVAGVALYKLDLILYSGCSDNGVCSHAPSFLGWKNNSFQWSFNYEIYQGETWRGKRETSM